MYKVTKEYESVKVAELEFSEENQERRMAKVFGEMVLTENREGTFWESLATGVRRGVKNLVEECLKEEMRIQLGVEEYQQSQSRRGYRSGYYQRDLVSTFGLIERFWFPNKERRKRRRHGDLKFLKGTGEGWKR